MISFYAFLSSMRGHVGLWEIMMGIFRCIIGCFKKNLFTWYFQIYSRIKLRNYLLSLCFENLCSYANFGVCSTNPGKSMNKFRTHQILLLLQISKGNSQDLAPCRAITKHISPSDGLWWSMMAYDDLWWSLVVYDCCWWSVMVPNGPWCSVMFRDVPWRSVTVCDGLW